MTETERVAALTAHPPGSHYALQRLRWTHDNPPPWRPLLPGWTYGVETFRLQAMAAVSRGGDPYAVLRDLKLRAPIRPPADPLAGEGP